MVFFKHVFLLSVIFLSGCVSDQPYEREVPLIPQDEKFHQSWFALLLKNFDEDVEVYSHAHKKVTFLVQPSFNDPLLIVIEKAPLREFTELEFVTSIIDPAIELRIKSYMHSYEVFEEGEKKKPWIGRVSHEKLIKDYYLKVIADDIFDVKFSMIRNKYRGTSQFSESENGCTDGTTFFVEIVENGKKQLLTRHNCDTDYKQELSKLSELFEFAIEEIEAAEKPVSEVLLRKK